MTGPGNLSRAIQTEGVKRHCRAPSMVVRRLVRLRRLILITAQNAPWLLLAHPRHQYRRATETAVPQVIQGLVGLLQRIGNRAGGHRNPWRQ